MYAEHSRWYICLSTCNVPLYQPMNTQIASKPYTSHLKRGLSNFVIHPVVLCPRSVTTTKQCTTTTITTATATKIKSIDLSTYIFTNATAKSPSTQSRHRTHPHLYYLASATGLPIHVSTCKSCIIGQRDGSPARSPAATAILDTDRLVGAAAERRRGAIWDAAKLAGAVAVVVHDDFLRGPSINTCANQGDRGRLASRSRPCSLLRSILY